MAESIATDLRQKILRGEFDDGPLPKQDDLIAQYGVSGPSVREALRILEAEGLLTVRRGKLGGAFAHKPDWTSAAFSFGMALQGQRVTLHDLAAAIVEIEPLCAITCARREDRLTAVVPVLRDNVARTEAALGTQGFTAVAREFHDIVVDSADSQSMRVVVRSLVAVWSVQEQLWATSMRENGDYPAEADQSEVIRTHSAITDAIESGDIERLQSIYLAHLRTTQALVLGVWGGRTVEVASGAALQAFRSI